MIPSNVTALMKTAVRVATLLPSRQADSSPSVAIFRENVVMNAVESAPSANKSRNRFGNRNAIRKASRYLPAPNKPAKTISRINRARDWTEWRCQQHPSRGCSFAGRPPSSSGNKEQCRPALRKKNFALHHEWTRMTEQTTTDHPDDADRA